MGCLYTRKCIWCENKFILKKDHMSEFGHICRTCLDLDLKTSEIKKKPLIVRFFIEVYKNIDYAIGSVLGAIKNGVVSIISGIKIEWREILSTFVALFYLFLLLYLTLLSAILIGHPLVLFSIIPYSVILYSLMISTWKLIDGDL